MVEPLLDVRDLAVEFPGKAPVRAVNGVSLTLRPGQVLGVLGESGSGKSMLLRTILGIQPAKARVTGQVWMRGQDLLDMPETKRAKTRGSWLSMVFQNPMTALDPVFTVEDQIVQPLMRHTGRTRPQARARALELLKLVQISSPERRLKAYPFELSGGMRQRVAIAAALACDTSLLLADEPTTALDVTVQARILSLLRSLQAELGMSVIVVTHDVGVAAEIAEEVVVMYAGRVVEHGSVRDVLRDPQHPYTQGLLAANVRPGQHERPVAIPGSPPNPAHLPPGCVFEPRCAFARDECGQRVPDLVSVTGSHEARCVLVTGVSEGVGEDARH
ncbi:ABC transporter ATP-binding protein [Actinocrispum wychmicini]|uniref:Peptide/nickel transport system ATP-binding protein n=1 Tax=Actinocrispum wychmicini TaxID=1213861 RepID=A0A4R2JUM0_9PSEU|nr:ABC transporter ATP-binding protein [Actinocrispum wychmicini]TCO60729.1 peptide/nickel transport system ATP-binding protein [Actinocrispum wychmicini]